MASPTRVVGKSDCRRWKGKLYSAELAVWIHRENDHKSVLPEE